MKGIHTDITLDAVEQTGHGQWKVLGTDRNGRQLSARFTDSLLYDSWYAHRNSDIWDTSNCLYTEREANLLMKHLLVVAATKRAIKSVNLPNS